jgi:hypothetical protein
VERPGEYVEWRRRAEAGHTEFFDSREGRLPWLGPALPSGLDLVLRTARLVPLRALLTRSRI